MKQKSDAKLLINIFGLPAVGKSTLRNALIEALGQEHCGKIPGDHYLKSKSPEVSFLDYFTCDNYDWDLIVQLEKIRSLNPDALIENRDTNFTEETKKRMYYERNSRAVETSDELVAFLVKTKESESLGTADTVEKAKKKGIPVKIFGYNLR